MKNNYFIFRIFALALSILMLSKCGNKVETSDSKGVVDTIKKEVQYDIKKGQKPTPDQIIEMMKKGNDRFVSGKMAHPNLDSVRLILANKENQSDYAFATILGCSDSRVPVEMIFDAGIMDLFIIRIAGNVADTDEIGTIEYGVGHVKTPLLIVMGHSKCGAVTAVTHAVEGKGHALEFNIPPLVDNIIPAVKKAIESHKANEEEIIPAAIEENVWQAISDVFLRSASVREKVKNGSLKVVGTIYDLETGKVNWLNQNKVKTIFEEVEKNPKRNLDIMAEEKKHK